MNHTDTQAPQASGNGRTAAPPSITDTTLYKSACEDVQEWLDKQPDWETAWENCTNIEWMFWALGKIGVKDDKTFRLFACWCCRETPLPDGRKVWDLLTDERSRNAVEVAELFANGEATQEERDAAWAAARDAAWVAARDVAEAAAWNAAWVAARDVAWATARDVAEAAAEAAAWDVAWGAAKYAAWDAAWAAQCKQLRTMIANPFRGNEVIYVAGN